MASPVQLEETDVWHSGSHLTNGSSLLSKILTYKNLICMLNFLIHGPDQKVKLLCPGQAVANFIGEYLQNYSSLSSVLFIFRCLTATKTSS